MLYRLASSIDDMATRKVSITLDEQVLDELKERVGTRQVSAYINELVAYELRMQHLDEYLAEAEERSGPIPKELLDRAEKLLDGEVDSW